MKIALKHQFDDATGKLMRSIHKLSLRQRLVIYTGITPFNFPAMVPIWIFALAIACGKVRLRDGLWQKALARAHTVTIGS